MTDHLTPTITDRGFKQMPTLTTSTDETVRIYESSSAVVPHIWLIVNHRSTAHLTLDEARQLSEQLAWLADHHYQVTNKEKNVVDGRCPECEVATYKVGIDGEGRAAALINQTQFPVGVFGVTVVTAEVKDGQPVMKVTNHLAGCTKGDGDPWA